MKIINKLKELFCSCETLAFENEPKETPAEPKPVKIYTPAELAEISLPLKIKKEREERGAERLKRRELALGTINLFYSRALDNAMNGETYCNINYHNYYSSKIPLAARYLRRKGFKVELRECNYVYNSITHWLIISWG